MGCCGSSENQDSIKKDRHQLETEDTKNVQEDLKPSRPPTSGSNKIQPFQEDNKEHINDSKFTLVNNFGIFLFKKYYRLCVLL